MFSSLHSIEEYLQELVPKTTQMKFTGEKGIERTKEFLKLLGSPQNKLKVIHIAGTSGKGSTSFMISNLLTSHGFRVGLHLSPHLIDVRERMMINNKMISEKQFSLYFTDVRPAIEKMKRSLYGPITYFEAYVGLAFYVFYKEKVDYAVMETGLGGEFDGTNIVDRSDKLSVITKIGFDHMNILGHTLQKIAHQKAMICIERGELITTKQSPSAQKEIQKVVDEKNGKLILADKNKKITTGLLGKFQKENALLALAVFSRLSERDCFKIDTQLVKNTLENLRFKGRFDVIKKLGGISILDGAHNAQKMKAFISSVRNLYPHKKFKVIVAFKQGKEYKKMLKYIIPVADTIIITHIFSGSQDLLHSSIAPQEIQSELKKLKFTNVKIVTKIEDIIQIIKKENDSCIVTGSLYLLGDIYKILNPIP